MKKRILALLLALCLVFSLAACANGGDEDSTQEPDEGNTSQDDGNEDPTPDDGEEPSQGSAVRDVINVGIQSDPADFAPWGANTTGRISALWGIYQPLVNFTIEGETDGCLLKDYTISDDGLTVSCELYDYIYDSAGNQMKASDVKFSFEKGVELGLISSVSFVDEVSVTGDYTFDFLLNRKMGVGEEQVLLQSWFVVTEASYNSTDDGMASQPIGTGPYEMTDYTPNYMFTYVAKDDYWQTDESLINVRDQQNVKQINYYIIAEVSQRATALETGQIDVCDCVGDDDLYMFEEGGTMSDQYWVSSAPDFRSMFVFPNLMEGKATADDINLRKAILYAVDASAVCQSVFGGRADPNYSFSPSFGIGYLDKWETEDNYYTNASIDKAKEYLEMSDYNGETLILLTETTSMVMDTALVVQGFLIEAGMNVEMLTVESTVMRSYMQSDEYDIMVTRNGITNYAVEGYTNVLDGTKWGNGSVNNIGDPEVQTLLAAARGSDATDEDLDALHQYIIENAYGRCICNYYLSFVVPNDMTEVTMSWRGGIMPGGCTYES